MQCILTLLARRKTKHKPSTFIVNFCGIQLVVDYAGQKYKKPAFTCILRDTTNFFTIPADDRPIIVPEIFLVSRIIYYA